MISEWSCDTEDLSNGCWKFSFANTEINYILHFIKIEKVILNCNNITQYYLEYGIYIRNLDEETCFKNFTDPNILNSY